MALFSTIEEFTRYVPVESATDLPLVLPDIRRAEKDYLVKYLGEKQYQALLTAYKAGSMDPDTPAGQLLEICQEAVASLAAWRFVPFGSVKISSGGIQVDTSGTARSAYRWQVDKLEGYFLQNGFNALEALLTFLEANKASFPDWAESAAYTLQKRFLINTAQDFTDAYNINASRRTFLALLPIQKKIEDLVITSSIGPGLMKAVKSEIKAGDLSEATQELLAWLQPALAHLVISEAVGILPLDFSDSGIVVNETLATEGKTGKLPVSELLYARKTQAAADGAQYLAGALQLLDDTSSADRYAPYFTSPLHPRSKTSQAPLATKIYGAF